MPDSQWTVLAALFSIAAFWLVVTLAGRDGWKPAPAIDCHWQKAATMLNLELSTDFDGQPTLTGNRANLAILVSEEFQISAAGGSGRFTRIRVSGKAVGRQVTLADARSARVFHDGPLVDRPLTGDAVFDERVRVRQAHAVSNAMLNASTRQLLTRLLDKGGLAVQRPHLCLLVRGGLDEMASFWSPTLEQCLEAAQRLSLSADGALEALIVMAESDPVEEVRWRSLEVLAAQFPESDAGQRAAQALLTASDPEMRLAAAKRLEGPAAGECLLNLVSSEGCIPGKVRADALAHLLDAYLSTDQGGVIALAAQSELEPLRQVAAEAMARPPHVARVARLLEQDSAGGGALTAATSAALVAMLSSGADGGPLAAARALGAVGTREAVEPLLQLAKKLAPGQGLRTAARDAVRQIQARLGAGGGGGLSLASSVGLPGALSLPSPESQGATVVTSSNLPPCTR
jgi:hypothetical protein